jgi:hypothetical protein
MMKGIPSVEEGSNENDMGALFQAWTIGHFWK